MTNVDRLAMASLKISFVKGASQNPPKEVFRGPLVWDATTLESSEAYTLKLSATDAEEIDAALLHFKGLGLDGDKVCDANFPLPKLGSRLRQGTAAIHNGRGLLLIRGLDPARYSSADSITIYLGIGSYIADKRGVQNKRGDMLTHVTDSKLWTVPREQRHGIHSNKELPFHTDMGSDIMALQVRQCAASGGNTFLASASSIYNDLFSTQPEALKELMSHSWPIQVSGKTSRFILSPLLAHHDGRLMVSLDPDRLGPHPGMKARRNTIPEISKEQRAALEAFNESAKRHQIRVPLQAGDLLFFNNWALVHRREGYEDGVTTSRHMVRLWLRNSRHGWKVPLDMASPWRAAFEPAATVDRMYPIEPMPEYKTPRYSAGSAAFIIESEDEGSEEDNQDGDGDL